MPRHSSRPFAVHTHQARRAGYRYRYRYPNPDIPYALLGGGATLLKSFTHRELSPFLSPDVVLPDTGRYTFLKYVHRLQVDQERRSNIHTFPVHIPVDILATRMNVAEMNVLIKIHKISLPRGSTRPVMLHALKGHRCAACDDHTSLFVSVSVAGHSSNASYTPDDLHRLPSQIRVLPVADLMPFSDIASDGWQLYERLWSRGAKLVSLENVEDSQSVTASTESHLVCNNVPWLILSRQGNRSVAALFAKLHGLHVSTRATKDSIITELSNHNCLQCNRFRAIFHPVVKPTGNTTRKHAMSDRVRVREPPEDIVGPFPEDGEHKFPPPPLSSRGLVDIVTDFCEELQPSKVSERGCAVCGQLTNDSKLVPLSDLKCSLAPLVEKGVARLERLTAAEPIRFDEGPILDRTCSSVCPPCVSSMRRGYRPSNALANGLWVGEVPLVLSRLTYAEQCLIAKVRSNNYVVRVAGGHYKLKANVISFPSPTQKVYEKLPPSRAEFAEVLAFIFTGPHRPTEEDLGRTPMLVRRNAVADALEWLKLNHCDYADLLIDREALAEYPECGIPVDVVARPMQSNTNVEPSATSLHDLQDEEGTTEGPCLFTVHGLVAEDLEGMSIAARKVAALAHLHSGGHVLAVGSGEQPESVYNNHQLYPQLFPWIFPYGLGGVGNAKLKGLMSEQVHKKHLLMYHDKRFQTEFRFLLLAFNHAQVKSGASRSFVLTKRSNFRDVITRLMSIDPAVLKVLSNRLQDGEKVVPVTEDEKRCYALMDQIDYIGGRVQGSLAGKKQMRHELWSLVACIGAPSWFITLSPVDSKHPLCIYWAGKDVEFNLDLGDQNEKIRRVAANPVAGARFFHFLVQLFIRHILRWADKDGRAGVFGPTSAYYGTVEQQGRMTLHLHMLLWIAGSWSPQMIRDKLMSKDSEFAKELIAYLESCQHGAFLTGDMNEVKAKFAAAEGVQHPDPTGALPVPPPKTECEDFESCTCESCTALNYWISNTFPLTVDHIILKSNVHKCFVRRDVVEKGVHKQHVTGKGCINKDGVCTARFPRDVFEESVISDDGRIDLRHGEPRLNTFNIVMAYLLGCNTDSSSMMSGTAMNAAAGYITDYLVKMGVKTHQIFSSVYDVFERNVDIWDNSKSESDAARRLILKMANSLTSKVEIGGPMAAMYLLGNPDHYSSHTFVSFYWRPYVMEVLRRWDEVEGEQSPVVSDGTVMDSSGVAIQEQEDAADDDIEDGDHPVAPRHDTEDDSPGADTVMVMRSGANLISRATIDDYKLRPSELEGSCVYEWVQCHVRKTLIQLAKSDVPFYRYQREHPLYETHAVVYDDSRTRKVVPTIMGGLLPRKDSEDRDFYCCTMLTFFVPWRTGLELRASTETWSDAFDSHPFNARALQLMSNFHIRYECYDGRDDYRNQMKARAAAQRPNEDELDSDDEDIAGDSLDNLGDISTGDLYVDGVLGKDHLKWKKQMQEVETVMYEAGWSGNGCGGGSTDVSANSATPIAPTANLSAKKWSSLVLAERNKVLNARSKSLPGTNDIEDMDIDYRPVNDARVIPGAYLLHDFRLNDLDIERLLLSVSERWELNKDQLRAFSIVTKHSISVNPLPLNMYVGGMGGTGKTRVINALQDWFAARGEAHRMVVLAPTGAAASLVGGSTYHTFLSVVTGDRAKKRKESGMGKAAKASLEAARLRMRGVDYIFLDEISMVSCHDMYLIDARLKEITRMTDIAFGGVNVIVAGDFAQLPPAKSQSLYSDRVKQAQTPRQEMREQEETLGMLLWHSFTTVVILKINMRQTGKDSADTTLRNVLGRMRYKDCTDEDIIFLKSMIPEFNPEIRISDPKWQNVSIITAWNSHKDQINDMNSKKFAAERGLQLSHFYSLDRQTRTVDTKPAPKSHTSNPVRLTPEVQQLLWNSQPHTSEHIPACLSLCIGLPVMIRNNEATELCITKGQEAIVRGWTSKAIPGYSDKQALETLFVELASPPKSVKIPHLETGTVPLTKIPTVVTAVLPTDQSIRLTRQQIPVLPNFAMTDYTSQGKTRPVNVVDIKKCKGHQAIYTCLSRGKSAVDTLILRDFKASKLQGGLHGRLRQEFRDLDILDEITQLRYEGKLPAGIVQHLRASTIANYRAYRAGGMTTPNVLGNDVQVQQRRANATSSGAGGNRKAASTMSWLNSLSWDSKNWSCAYDSYITILRFIWSQSPLRWSSELMDYGVYMTLLSDSFARVQSGALTMNTLRSGLRVQLHSMCPNTFPNGEQGTDIISLVRVLTGLNASPAFSERSSIACSSCPLQFHGHLSEAFGRYTVVRHPLDSVLSLKDYVTGMTGDVGQCTRCGGALRLNNSYPPMVTLQLPLKSAEVAKRSLRLDPVIHVQSMTYILSGIVYWASEVEHFTSRLIDNLGRVYAYDDMVAGGSVSYAGLINPTAPVAPSWLSVMGSKAATLAVYIRQEVEADVLSDAPAS